MLFVLTGNIQTGKSRWLEALVGDLTSQGTPVYGVMAPGIWVESDGPHANADGFEKLGIDNVLLPQNERVHFARRRDLARAEGAYDTNAQSARAGLGWHISDDALTRVNEHLASIPHTSLDASRPGLLVVDELGSLELVRGDGLVEAMLLLAAGPTNSIAHALIVVRADLVDHVPVSFVDLWGGCAKIAPDEAAAHQIKAALG